MALIGALRGGGGCGPRVTWVTRRFVAVALLGLDCCKGLAARLAAVAGEPLGEEATAAGATVPGPLPSQPPRFTRPDSDKAV